MTTYLGIRCAKPEGKGEKYMRYSLFPNDFKDKAVFFLPITAM